MSWSPAALPAGHALRAAVARALALMGLAVVVFVAFTVLTTQVPSVRSGSPWQDDPYDAVVSFTELFVPGLATLAGLRALLWRTSEPLPVARVDGLLRAAQAAAVLIMVTVATDLVALAVRADHQLWNHLTFVSIVALAIMGVTLGAAVVPLWRTHRAVQELLVADERGDWLADLPPLAAQLTSWMPPRLRGAMLGLVAVIGRWPLLPGHLPGITGGAVLLLGGADRSIETGSESRCHEAEAKRLGVGRVGNVTSTAPARGAPPIGRGVVPPLDRLLPWLDRLRLLCRSTVRARVYGRPLLRLPRLALVALVLNQGFLVDPLLRWDRRPSVDLRRHPLRLLKGPGPPVRMIPVRDGDAVALRRGEPLDLPVRSVATGRGPEAAVVIGPAETYRPLTQPGEEREARTGHET